MRRRCGWGILGTRKRHPLMAWDESLATMRTLDRWRTTVGLHDGEDDPPAAAPGDHAACAASGPAAGL
jgi:hypothetical protein